jgi:uncharacterized protein YecE (DUF72 family)
VGCCGWTQSQKRYLATFPAIEIQQTFYQPPDVSVVKRWRQLAPPGFRFCIKAWQLITHTPASPTYRRLGFRVGTKENDLYGSFRPTDEVALAWERTQEVANILDASVIVFQCPASFLPTRENIRNFKSFMAQVDRAGRALAWEPRGEAWLPPLIRDLCAEYDLIDCVDPFKRDSVSGGSLYWRLHGRDGYRYHYTDEDLSNLRARLAARLDGSVDYVMFNNMSSRQDAVRFLEMNSGGSVVG